MFTRPVVRINTSGGIFYFIDYVTNEQRRETGSRGECNCLDNFIQENIQSKADDPKLSNYL